MDKELEFPYPKLINHGVFQKFDSPKYFSILEKTFSTESRNRSSEIPSSGPNSNHRRFIQLEKKIHLLSNQLKS